MAKAVKWPFNCNHNVIHCGMDGLAVDLQSSLERRDPPSLWLNGARAETLVNGGFRSFHPRIPPPPGFPLLVSRTSSSVC